VAKYQRIRVAEIATPYERYSVGWMPGDATPQSWEESQSPLRPPFRCSRPTPKQVLHPVPSGLVGVTLMSTTLIVGLILLAVWFVETIVILASYKHSISS
jgi:hypothetical protein